ncbi:hypothetical protein TNCV_4712301 [Trichonephila clavipes]|nr:hypothetical protein TNCV_4712301 [Trichonephila clavipes]
MGLRTVYQSRYPKIDCHPLPSHRDAPVTLSNKKQQKKQPNKNIWTEKAKERVQKSAPRQQKPSYASVTAQNVSKTNTFDANSIMEQMGQMMQQWGTMIAFLQQNNKN